MIVRNLKNSTKVDDPNHAWSSTRMLLKEDNMGFSFHITTIFKGADIKMHYLNHLESVYCIEGSGEIVDCNKGQTHRIEPGVLYALNENDKHILRCFEEMKLACVFNPPIKGDEVHNKDGAYELD